MKAFIPCAVHGCVRQGRSNSYLCIHHEMEYEHVQARQMFPSAYKTGDGIWWVSVWIALAFILTGGIYLWATRPIVQFSWGTKECVAVLFADAQWSCDNLPRRYEVEWVK